MWPHMVLTYLHSRILEFPLIIYQSLSIYIYIYLSGWWFGAWIWFFHILGIVIPTDIHIFQRGRYTTNQISCDIRFGYINGHRLQRTQAGAGTMLQLPNAGLPKDGVVQGAFGVLRMDRLDRLVWNQQKPTKMVILWGFNGIVMRINGIYSWRKRPSGRKEPQ